MTLPAHIHTAKCPARRAMRKAFSAVETLYAACDQAGNSRRGATGASIHSISCTPVSSRARAGGSASTMLWVQWHPKLGPAGAAFTLSIGRDSPRKTKTIRHAEDDKLAVKAKTGQEETKKTNCQCVFKGIPSSARPARPAHCQYVLH